MVWSIHYKNCRVKKKRIFNLRSKHMVRRQSWTNSLKLKVAIGRLYFVQNPNPLIPPIFGTNEFGWCCERNSAMTKITGWKKDDAMDKIFEK
ncbi:hypothetical protein S245_018666 [Arachis hypogaea]